MKTRKQAITRAFSLLLALTLLFTGVAPSNVFAEDVSKEKENKIYYWKVYTTDIAPGEENLIEWFSPTIWDGMGFSWSSSWDLGYDTIKFHKVDGENWVFGSDAKKLSQRKVGDTFYYLNTGHIDVHKRRLTRNGAPLAKCTIKKIYPFTDGTPNMYNVGVSLVQAYKHIGYARSYNKDMFKKYELDKYREHPRDYSLYFETLTEEPTGDVKWIQDEDFQTEKLEKEKADLEKTKADLEKANADLEKDKKNLENQVNDLNKEKTELEKEIENLKAQLDKCPADSTGDIDKLKVEIAEKEQLIKELEEKIKEKDEAIKELEEEKANTKDNIDELNNKIKELLDKIAELTKELQDRIKQNEALIKEKEEYEREKEEYKREREWLREFGNRSRYYEYDRDKTRKLEKDNNDLLDKNKDLESQILDFKKQLQMSVTDSPDYVTIFDLNSHLYKTFIKSDLLTQAEMTDAKGFIKPFVSNSRTMLPMRYLALSLGMNVDWDNKTRTATFTNYGGNNALRPGVVTINADTLEMKDGYGNLIYVDAKPILKDGRFYISITNVIRAFGGTNGDVNDRVKNTIEWDALNRKVLVYKNIK